MVRNLSLLAKITIININVKNYTVENAFTNVEINYTMYTAKRKNISGGFKAFSIPIGLFLIYYF